MLNFVFGNRHLGRAGPATCGWGPAQRYGDQLGVRAPYGSHPTPEEHARSCGDAIPTGIYLRAEGIRERTLNMALTRATEWTTWPLPYGPLVLPATTGDVILIDHQALIIPGSGGNGASRLCYRFAGQGTTPLITLFPTSLL